MAQLLSTWYKGVQSVPKSYVLPFEKRPDPSIKVCKELPVIDLQNNRSEVIHQILKAGQEFGAFQVINHGVSEKLMADMMDLYCEIFNMATDDGNYGEGYNINSEGYKLYTSGGLSYNKEDVHFWKDTFLQPACYPVEEHAPSWPDKPTRYREEFERYVVEVRKMAFKILDLLEEGFGLNAGYLGAIMQEQGVIVNRYPPCPDPSLVMGLAAHKDHGFIALLQQDQYGLQIEIDGKWMGVEPIPNAFVINFGCMLEIISNGILKSVEHRVVANSSVDRLSITTYLTTKKGVPAVIQPAKELVTASRPQMFKSSEYNDFLAHFIAFLSKPDPHDGTVLDAYRL